MKSPKFIKSNIAIMFIALSLAVSVCTSVVCNMISANNKRSSVLNSSIKDASEIVSDFSGDYAYNAYSFSDKLYAKANTVDLVAGSKTTEEENASLVKNLYIKSFAVTNANGTIVNAYPTSLIGSNMMDDKNLMQFKPNLKGIKFKSTTVPQKEDGEEGIYSVLASVTRNEGGIVIIEAEVDDYYKVSGERLAESCQGKTIISKDGKVVSTNISDSDKTELEHLGVTKNISANSEITLNINDKQYVFRTNNVDGYIIFSGVEGTAIEFDYFSLIVIPLIVSVVLFIVFAVLASVIGKKAANLDY